MQAQTKLKFAEVMINGVEVSAKQVTAQHKKYLEHFQGRVSLVADSTHNLPYFFVEHDPGYNKLDHHVWMDKDGNWHCNCTGYIVRKWCSHIFAVLFERGY